MVGGLGGRWKVRIGVEASVDGGVAMDSGVSWVLNGRVVIP